jgi:hypothetical protein
MSRSLVPFWAAMKPEAPHDIARLRPSSLPRGQRFETDADVRAESIRSESELRYGGGRFKAEYLKDCRDGYFICKKTYCPICARKYRRWLCSQLLRLYAEHGEQAVFAVVLLKSARQSKISRLDPRDHAQWIRKRVARAGFNDDPIVCAFEMVYKARTKRWILHANLVLFGVDDTSRVETALRNSTTKGVDCQPVNDSTKQLSYLSKFATYHRPYRRKGQKPSRALPLNTLQHCELVRWMDRWRFTDLLLLINCRRSGGGIVPRLG